MYEEMLDEEEEEASDAESEDVLKSPGRTIGEAKKVRHSQLIKVTRAVTSGTYVDIERAENTLRRLEAFLLHSYHPDPSITDPDPKREMKTDVLFQMAGCPFTDAMEIYLRRRDAAFKTKNLRRREILKVIISGTDVVDTLCGYLQSRIDANDQLLFKILLVTMNLLTVLGEYVFKNRKSIEDIIYYDVGSGGGTSNATSV